MNIKRSSMQIIGRIRFIYLFIFFFLQRGLKDFTPIFMVTRTHGLHQMIRFIVLLGEEYIVVEIYHFVFDMPNMPTNK